MDAVITTADWFRYIESLGPSDDRDSLRLRIESAGADPEHAAWLLSIDRRRRIARKVASVGIGFAIVGGALSAYQWWLALRGALNAPEIADTVIPAGLLAIGALILVIASGVELSPPLNLSDRMIPAELPPPPRQVGYSIRASAARRMAAGVFCLMLAPLAMSVTDVRNRVWLRDHGAETTGHVTETYTRKGSKGSIDYYYRYEFDHGTGVQAVGRERFEQTRVGDTVPVTYLPSRPEINRATTKARLHSWAIDDPVLAIAMLYLLLIVPVIALLAGRGMSRQRTLAERGVATMAEVTRVRQQVIDYRFGDQAGRFMFGRRRLRERPAVGQPLVILYDPDKPKRSAPLGAIGDFELR